MKRPITIVAALVLGIAPCAVAQSGLGIKGGLSFGNVSNRGFLPGNLDTRTGFAGGLALGLFGGDPLSVNVEGLYAQRGVGSASDSNSRRLDYIDVPAYLRFTLPTPGLAPFAYAGPQMSFEVRCRAGGSDCPMTAAPRPATPASSARACVSGPRADSQSRGATSTGSPT